MKKQRYLVDGEPCSMNGIIRKAREMDADYEYSLFSGAQRAMETLRDNGFTIEENPKRFIDVKELNPAVRRGIKDMSALLEKKFYRAWEFTNPKGEKFLFGRFGKLRDDPTIVTLAVENRCCNGGWELVH